MAPLLAAVTTITVKDAIAIDSVRLMALRLTDAPERALIPGSRATIGGSRLLLSFAPSIRVLARG